jgi:hypothetical protein
MSDRAIVAWCLRVLTLLTVACVVTVCWATQ